MDRRMRKRLDVIFLILAVAYPVAYVTLIGIPPGYGISGRFSDAPFAPTVVFALAGSGLLSLSGPEPPSQT